MTTSRHTRQQPNNNIITIFFSTVLYQSKFKISNYELMNEVCIVFLSCLHIKVSKSMCNYH